MSHLYSHFSHLSGSPKPVRLSSLFRGSHAGAASDQGIAQQFKDITGQLSAHSSALESIFGGGVLGGVAKAATSGFSWQSVLKDVLPFGGLISGIAGLFKSTPVLDPLTQYDAPASLNFNAVLGSDGQLSQGSSNQYGYSRASSSGLDLVDSVGGPSSPYQRATNGALVAAAGDATVRYPGTLNLPAMLSSLTQPAASQSAPVQALASNTPGTPGAPVASAAGPSPSPSTPLPEFDRQWFDDHGSLIASAVRNQLLNFHPIVDTINDL